MDPLPHEDDESGPPPPGWFDNYASPPLPDAFLPRDHRRQPGQHVWLIAGATTNFGRALAQACLARGDRVAGIGWSADLSTPQMQGFMRATAAQVVSRGVAVDMARCVLGLTCEPRVRRSVDDRVRHVLAQWGRIDVVVLGFQYGIMSSCEDHGDDDIRFEFENNVYATLNIIASTLTFFRSRADGQTHQTDEEGDHTGMADDGPVIQGRYIVLNPVIGLVGTPGLGPYVATRYALEAIVESMTAEVEQAGIRLTTVYIDRVYPIPSNPPLSDIPGGESGEAGETPESSAAPSVLADNITNLPASLSSVHLFTPLASSLPSSDYSYPTAPAAHLSRMVEWTTREYQRQALARADQAAGGASAVDPNTGLALDGVYAGDGAGEEAFAESYRCADTVWRLGHAGAPPIRFPIGTIAAEAMQDRIRLGVDEIEDWKFLHFPGGP